MRLIDADELNEHKFVGNKFVQIGGRTNGKTLEAVNRAYQQGWNDAIDAIIGNAPTVEPKKGKWIPEKMNDKHNIGWLDKEVNIMEEDAKQASIPYSMPKDYIKNRLDYER